ncbi:MAG: glycosyltransferase family 2 protein [Chloroflexi bacterium]|nr:glycosyltransferase family 2 protein [Chloroflexota bacterium]
MDGPLVSVVVPVYNGDRYVADALESVVAQDYRPIEIVVVDDGSTDRTSEIALSLKEVRYARQSNRGVSVARNVGISMSHGELIAFIDADDLWCPSKLSLQVSYLLDHHEAGYVLAKQRCFLDPGSSAPPWFRAELLMDHVGFVPSALVVRRAVLEKIGVFDPELRIGEDSDWFFRARDAGVQVGVVTETLVYKRVHSDNLTSRTDIGHPLLLRIVRASLGRRHHVESPQGHPK